MQIRYLETLQQMAGTPGTKVIFLPDSNNRITPQDAWVFEQMQNH
jgi:regulator of protease activity HflC (stomatin/prohibitin superfamily)